MINNLKEVTGINNDYLLLGLLSLILYLVIKLIIKLIEKGYSLKDRPGKVLFNFNQRVNIFGNIIYFLCLFLLWDNHLHNIVTIISFISAGATIALREVILNIIAGFYIKVAKPLEVEDRIEIDGVKGDVVLINLLNFKVLELGNRLNGEQSSGIIVNIPSSMIFKEPLKNYTTAFKYIWSELVVNINFDSDIDKTKEKLYEIVNKNEVVKRIPKKMDKAIDEASGTYRIYYNNLKPIIYTGYNEDHIELTIRFLVHPKKERYVIDDLWTNIIKEAQLGNIKLYKGD